MKLKVIEVRIMEIHITKRQQEIAIRQSAGETEQAVAMNMGISINTIRYHKKKLFKILNANCMTEVISKLKNKGII